MKLAVKKEPGIIPGSGFHYMLFPNKMENDFEVEAFSLMGHVIIEVPNDQGEKLLAAGRKALMHQIEIAKITDQFENIGINKR